MTILITGSSGKTAGPLADILATTHDILVASRTPHTVPRYDTVTFDWLNFETWENPFNHMSAVMDPIKAVYLVSPDIQDARDQVFAFINFARERGVKRFVLLSAWEVPEGGALLGKTHSAIKFLGERKMIEWAVLRPHFFMENFREPHHLTTIRNENKIYTACGGGKKPFISARDIAAVAATLLTDEKPLNDEVIITGSESLTYTEVANTLSDILGRKIEHVKLSRDEFEKKLHAEFGMSSEMATYMADLDDRVSGGLGWETTGNVERITGRQPRKLRDAFEQWKLIWDGSIAPGRMFWEAEGDRKDITM